MKFLIFLIFLSCSCFDGAKGKNKLDDIKTDMASFNKQLRGRLYRYKMPNDIRRLDKAIYLQSIKEVSESSSQYEYKRFFLDKVSNFLIKTNKASFVVCVESKEQLLVLCDRASTGMLDKVETNAKHSLQFYLDNVSLNN